jgi:hypothetical protein
VLGKSYATSSHTRQNAATLALRVWNFVASAAVGWNLDWDAAEADGTSLSAAREAVQCVLLKPVKLCCSNLRGVAMPNLSRFPIAVAVKNSDMASLGAVKSWLMDNVGAIDLDWDYAFNFDSSSAPSQYSVYFKNRSPAVLFKLTWCGFA